MKNLFKFGFLAFALTLGLASCGSGAKTEAAVDSAATTLDSAATGVDSTAAAAVDSAATKVDSLKK